MYGQSQSHANTVPPRVSSQMKHQGNKPEGFEGFGGIVGVSAGGKKQGGGSGAPQPPPLAGAAKKQIPQVKQNNIVATGSGTP